MKYKRLREDLLVLRLETGDKIRESIMKCCYEAHVNCGKINGIGAGEDFKLAVYRKNKKAYKRKRFKGEHEIVSLKGNITLKDNKPYIHLHISIANEDMKLYGGHLEEGTITATAEIFINIIEEERIKRKYNQPLNIYLMDI
ncbi:PPC domain-containing DNA-binding protein [Oceanirhabdus sp. W0125-5]|uniref:PPC domain-containing DNA-binding protein n=1 Tax=Oceanirhabdus sp. W0125-5 TaxID=2999116 RepID=UPI0022F2BACC|nr:PPC domain-containing DNA-binding protein [Oceanirhabdus sp. W0125-5]WBW98208.1 DNA-binding protein [Oceanirhabdus sp. W0125-5]